MDEGVGFVARLLEGEKIGIKQVDDRLCLAAARTCDPGCFDEDACRPEPIEVPFDRNVLSMSRE